MKNTKKLSILLLLPALAICLAVSAPGQVLTAAATPGAPSQAASPGAAVALPLPAYNALILQEIRTMPTAGGYSANHAATQCLGASVLLTPFGLDIAAARAQPSYCSGATYLVFLKVVSALQHSGELSLDPPALAALAVNGQRDGQGIWGRWNANGPGTARLFHEMNLGTNSSDYAQARPGDFMKIFWNGAVGRKEHGHSVVYLGTENVNGVDSVRFWSSNLGIGYGEKTVPRSKIVFPVFSRLTAPRNLAHAAAITPQTDPYLAGLLTKDSSFAEVRALCGM